MSLIKDLFRITILFAYAFILWIYHRGKVNTGNNPRYRKKCIKENKTYRLGSQRNPKK